MACISAGQAPNHTVGVTGFEPESSDPWPGLLDALAKFRALVSEVGLEAAHRIVTYTEALR